MLRKGDRVQWHYLGKTGDIGTVVKVTPKRLSGGSKASVHVRWDKNGHVGRCEDRVLRPAPAPSPPPCGGSRCDCSHCLCGSSAQRREAKPPPVPAPTLAPEFEGYCPACGGPHEFGTCEQSWPR